MVNMNMGKANASPAREWVPSWPTKYISATMTPLPTRKAIMFGAASRARVPPMGPFNSLSTLRCIDDEAGAADRSGTAA